MSKKSLILVIIQFSCFAFFAFDSVFKSNHWLFYIQIVGFLLAVWGVLVMKIGGFNVQPEVKNNASIIKKGPYKIIRNPMYLGIILFIGVAVITDFNYMRLSIFAILTTVLFFKIYMEESFMKERFGKEYIDYKQSTYRLIPFVC